MSKRQKNNPVYDINDQVYKRIKDKFDMGLFSYGQDLRFEKKWVSDDDLSNYSASDYNDELFSSLVECGIFGLLDVPSNYRTNKFYISQFLNKDVYDYIKNNINDFDREFFKDLITSCEHCTMLSDINAFLIMPLEYIDEEMCSLAMLRSTWCSASQWFNIVLSRKPSALTEDLWKLGARLYANCSINNCPYVDATPDEYKDDEYYNELCQCQFSRGNGLWKTKKNIMKFIPEDLKYGIAKKVFALDTRNVSFFSDDMLELPASSFGFESREKLWQYLIRINGFNIKCIPLNMDRIVYFTSLYDRHSNEYKRSFRDSVIDYINDSESDTLLPVNSFSSGSTVISSEYLRLIYSRLGIIVNGRINELFYCVKLPDGWMVKKDGNNFNLVDEDGNVILSFYVSSQTCDKEVYVTYINDKLSERGPAILIKK